VRESQTICEVTGHGVKSQETERQQMDYILRERFRNEKSEVVPPGKLLRMRDQG
jgi:hypothetical protein